MHALKLLLDTPELLAGRESVHDNVYWRGARPILSVCVPARGCDMSPFLTTLSGLDPSGLVEVIIYDDGRCGHDVLANMQASAGHAPAAVRIVSTPYTPSRAAARGALARHARTCRIMLLDGASEIDASHIALCLEAIRQASTAPLSQLQARAS